MATKILFIGQGIFSEGLSRLIGDVPGVEIIGAVETCDQAETIFEESPPDIIIVDYDQGTRNREILDALLDRSPVSTKVIYLTLSENKMVIQNRQQLSDVTLSVLIETLQNLAGGDAA